MKCPKCGAEMGRFKRRIDPLPSDTMSFYPVHVLEWLCVKCGTRYCPLCGMVEKVSDDDG